MQNTARPKGLKKIWREIKRPFRQTFGRHSTVPGRAKNVLEGMENIHERAANNPEHVESFCPICRKGSDKPFRPFGLTARSNALCPSCGSLERHRFFWLFFEETLKNWKKEGNGSLLHFAPEGFFKTRFEQVFGENYLSCDIVPGRAMKVIDITSICLGDETYDYVVCNHVLEHIPDDRQALSELYRVLKKGGVAFLAVPLKGEKTDEDLSITDPQERLKRFAQDDHVRFYGMDIKNRIEGVGFHVSVVNSNTVVPSECLRTVLGIMSDDILFVAEK